MIGFLAMSGDSPVQDFLGGHAQGEKLHARRPFGSILERLGRLLERLGRLLERLGTSWEALKES